MNNPNVLNIQQPNKLAIMAASGTMAVAGMLGFGADKADARVMETSDITCTTVDPVNPGTDPCVGNIGNRIISHEASDYPAVDIYSKRTLYIRPDGIRTALYDLDSEGTLTPANTQDDIKRTVTWAANGSVLDCQVIPYNGNQSDECVTYDAAYGTANVPMSDELTLGVATTDGGGTTDGGETGGDGTTGGGETGGTTGGGNNGGTTVGVEGPNLALIQDCVNRDANIAKNPKAIKNAKILLPRTTFTNARFSTIKQVDAKCADVDTNRTITAQYYQIGMDGLAHAVTRRINMVNEKNDNGRLHARKFRSIRTLLCGKNQKYWVVFRANSYSDLRTKDGTIRITDTNRGDTVSTRKYAKACK